MNKTAWLAMILTLVAATVATLYFYGHPFLAMVTDTAPAVTADATPDNDGGGDPEVAPPVGDVSALPKLNDSDLLARQTAEALFGAQRLTLLLVPQQLIRHFVVTVDSLDGPPVQLHDRPLRHAEGLPQVSASDNALLWSPNNAQRYRPYVRLLQDVDTDKLVDAYFRLYPLLQAAYQELGYRGRQFNTRLLAIIDHLLATPVVDGPIEVVRPKVLYEFADPNLESLSWGQKLMLRIGADNAAIVSERLRAIRAAIIARLTPHP